MTFNLYSFMSRFTAIIISVLLIPSFISGCSDDGKSSGAAKTIVVNSILDTGSPAEGEITLRAAIEQIPDGGTILFDPELNGETVLLTRIGEQNSILRGEAFDGGTFLGYIERNYGPSALYAGKNITIDASDLPDGIRIHWAHGKNFPARVLAVYGNLTLKNLTITGGYSKGLELNDGSGQPYTLARGGGVAVWGLAVIDNCTIAGNTLAGDTNAGRDRGAFGGGIYSDLLHVYDSVISGNRVSGYGAAGGGIYSVGGADFTAGNTEIHRTAVTGNRIQGLHTYGGGVYSDGGGRGKAGKIYLENCTVARNVVEQHPEIDIPDELPSGFQFYYRGGGLYMSNGYMTLISCTVVENEVTGREHRFSNRPNIGGGGIAATIGDAHAVEELQLRHSIVTGNTLNGEPEDIFTGSLFYFLSEGYNLAGRIDFRRMLVPVPRWYSLSRKYWPMTEDSDGITADDILEDPVLHDTILSAGIDEGSMAVLWYPVKGDALNRIPASEYTVTYRLGQESGANATGAGIQEKLLEWLNINYSDELGADFGEDIDSALITAEFHGPGYTWPREPENADWIAFWMELETLIGDSLGEAGLGSDIWDQFLIDEDVNFSFTLRNRQSSVTLAPVDQNSDPRPGGASGKGDVGAVEMQ